MIFKKSDLFGIYSSGFALTICLFLVFYVLFIIFYNGLSVFWPKPIYSIEYETPQGNQLIFGEKVREDALDEKRLYRTGFREINQTDFKWLEKDRIQRVELPEDMTLIQRYEWGNLYTRVLELQKNKVTIFKKDAPNFQEDVRGHLKYAAEQHEKIKHIDKNLINTVNQKIQRLKKEIKTINYKNLPYKNIKIKASQQKIQVLYKALQKHQANKLQIINQLKQFALVVESHQGDQEIFFDNIEGVHWINQMDTLDKVFFYVRSFFKFLSEEPREANTEGGIFPAIFGTMILVVLMSIFVAPLGVLVSIYLSEYAKDNWFSRLVRVSINNMAGVPAIVYGIFGLGFFIYFLGGSLDRLLYPEYLPTPTWGTPGMLWSALTLALLTLPVVVVSTEEGLSRIPKNIREASWALGCTRFEMIKVIFPMILPSMMTGLILAIARAAGEVSPLMLVGAVKLAPAYVIDQFAPFFHFDRKFMHIGFHIYDLGFQSPNIEITRPLVFVTALLLICIVLSLNIVAIVLRSKLKEKYRIL